MNIERPIPAEKLEPGDTVVLEVTIDAGLEEHKIPKRDIFIEVKKVEVSDGIASVFFKNLQKPIKYHHRGVVYVSHNSHFYHEE